MTAIFWWLTTPSAASVLCMCGWMSSLRGSLRAITTWMAGQTTPEVRPAKSVTHSDGQVRPHLVTACRWGQQRVPCRVESAREVRRTARIAAISSFTSEYPLYIAPPVSTSPSAL